MTFHPALRATLLALATTSTLATSTAFAGEDRSDWLDIEMGKSIVLELPQVPRAISVTNPMVADIIQLGAPTRWQIQGKSIGTTDLVIQFSGDIPPMLYEITVHRDLSDLIRRIDGLIDGVPPKVYPLNERIVVEGAVPDLDTLERISRVAGTYDPDFVNLMTVSGDHQVQLEVIIAEVARTSLRQAGVNLFWSGSQMGAALQNGDIFGTQPGGGFDTAFQPRVSLTSWNLTGRILSGINIYGALELLDNHNLAKVSAQPTLVTMSGQQAEFLVGGEFPVGFPNAQGNVTIKFKKFGTRLLFIPTVLADEVIDVQLEAELSAVDPGVSVTLNNITVPGLTSRIVKTHVRLRSGMTLAIAGMLSERVANTRDEVPGLGRIPILGMFFRKVVSKREETELMVYVTPRLVRPLAPGELPPILGTTENNNPSDLALFLLGADRRAKSRTAEPTGDVGLQR
jgi:pilus assembly protein CpaC